MSIYHGIRAARKALNRKANNPLRIAGVTGNGEGTVETGTANLIYCLTAEGDVVQAWAYNCPHVYGLPVWLTQSERRPGALEVAAIRDIGSQNSSQQAEVGKHGDSHRWLGLRGGGYDPTFIELRQFMPFGLWCGNDPEAAFLLRVGRGVIWTGVQFVELQPSTLDLTAYLPTTVGAARYARFVLIYVASKDSGTAAEVKAVAGTAVAGTVLTLEDIPAAPSGTLLVIGAVRMYSDQEMILDGRTATDIIDLRFPFRALVEAGDIGSGLISTDRFSAYADLVAESKIGPGSAQVALGAHTHAFDDLSNVDTTGATDGSVPVFEVATGKWKAGTFRRGAPERETFAVVAPASTPHYDLLAVAETGGLGVYYNGVRILDADFTLDVDGLGFTLDFDVASGDYVVAEYFTPAPPTALFPLTRTWTLDRADGIFGYLATGGGARAWVNPALGDAWSPSYYTATQIDLWAVGTPDKATDGSYLTTNASHTGNTTNAWWKADFGTRLVCPTRFGMIGRATDGYHPRNWKLQGSNDDTNWDDLLTVVNDGPGDGTWYSAAISTSTYYRFIRVYETGVNSHGDWYLVIGEVEIWGTMEDA